MNQTAVYVVYVVGRQEIDMRFYSTQEKGNREKGAMSKVNVLLGREMSLEPDGNN